MIGKRYKGEKKEHGGDRKSIMHSAQLNPTIQKIAEQSKVNPSTVQRAEKFADAVDEVAKNTLPESPPKLFSSRCFNCLLID